MVTDSLPSESIAQVDDLPPTGAADMRRVIVSGMIGNGLEWYDYALYGQVALLLSQKFFPKGVDPLVTMLAVYGVFAAGFLVRPLGAVFFGWMGDTYGRRAAMVTAVLMMAIPTGCVGLLPTYSEIGLAAPILLTIIRLLQGLSLGGEFSGSIAFIVEHAPPNRRGLAGVASVVSLVLGFLLGLLVIRGGVQLLGQEAFNAWGWRVPFLLGVGIGLVGFYIRNHCSESPVYEEARRENALSKTPVREAIVEHPWEIIQGFVIYISLTMPFYLTTVYFINFSKSHLKVPEATALDFATFNMLGLLAIMPFSAWLSDKIGRKPVMLGALAIMFSAVYPLFMMMQPGASHFQIGLAQFLFALTLSGYLGPIAALLVELFPTSVRFTGMSITYNLPAVIFGGTAPMVCEYLISSTGTSLSIAGYVMCLNIISMIAFIFYKDRYHEPLR